jgi:hypothetical protein
LSLTRDTETRASAIDRASVEDHDWMEVTYLLRYELPEIFREVLMKLRARYQVYLRNLQNDEFAETVATEGAEDEELGAPKKNTDDGDDDDDEESAL